jgi:hypothetical protein
MIIWLRLRRHQILLDKSFLLDKLLLLHNPTHRRNPLRSSCQAQCLS